MDIVICHCHEDLSWLVDGSVKIPRVDVRIWVYEKCGETLKSRQILGPLLETASVKVRYSRHLKSRIIGKDKIEGVIALYGQINFN